MIPLFPLNTVLFPGGVLPLRVFEPRYLDMISECLRSGDGFGISLIESGPEVGGPAQCHAVGTLARVSDWESLPGGMLGITVTGMDRFRIGGTSVRGNNLLKGEPEWLAEGEAPAVNEIGTGRYAWVRPLVKGTALARDAEVIESGRLSFRLAEFMSLPVLLRQQLLELDSEYDRLDRIYDLLQPANSTS